MKLILGNLCFTQTEIEELENESLNTDHSYTYASNYKVFTNIIGFETVKNLMKFKILS